MFIFFVNLSLGAAVFPEYLRSSGCSNGYYATVYGLTTNQQCTLLDGPRVLATKLSNSCGVIKFNIEGLTPVNEPGFSVLCAGSMYATGFHYGTGAGYVCSDICTPYEEGCSSEICSAGCNNGVCSSTPPIISNTKCDKSLGITDCYDSYSCNTGVKGTCTVMEPARDCYTNQECIDEYRQKCCLRNPELCATGGCDGSGLTCDGAIPLQTNCEQDSICVGGDRTPYEGCVVASDCTTCGDHTGEKCKCPSTCTQNPGKVNANCGSLPNENCLVVGDEDGNGKQDCEDPACFGKVGPNGKICCSNINNCTNSQPGTSSQCVTCDAVTIGKECNFKPNTPLIQCTGNNDYLCSNSIGGIDGYNNSDFKMPSLGYCDGVGKCNYAPTTGITPPNNICLSPEGYSASNPLPSSSECKDGQSSCEDMRITGSKCYAGSGCKSITDFCVDVDGDGSLGDANNLGGECRPCNGANGDVCGAIAHNGTEYGVCTGTESGTKFYGCADQSWSNDNDNDNINDGDIFKTICETNKSGGSSQNGGATIRTGTSSYTITNNIYNFELITFSHRRDAEVAENKCLFI